MDRFVSAGDGPVSGGNCGLVCFPIAPTHCSLTRASHEQTAVKLNGWRARVSVAVWLGQSFNCAMLCHNMVVDRLFAVTINLKIACGCPISGPSDSVQCRKVVDNLVIPDSYNSVRKFLDKKVDASPICTGWCPLLDKCQTTHHVGSVSGMWRNGLLTHLHAPFAPASSGQTCKLWLQCISVVISSAAMWFGNILLQTKYGADVGVGLGKRSWAPPDSPVQVRLSSYVSS